ncbi:NADH-ubiquinone oxidoreductase 105 kDa subunit [Pyronema omphalodes]|nr:NADH-ubiquinone oxidoreductase 105 kDa subunit [Pyronema omphalodes]
MASRYAFSTSLKELRFLFCQTGEQSAAVRQFLQKSYPVMKKHNPYTPILIREAQGIEPKLFARYEFGKETQVPLTGLSGKQIEEKVATIVQASA